MYLSELNLLELIRPHTVLGFLGLLSMLGSLFFSIARRDGHHALFFICLGWHLAFAEVVWRIYTGYGLMTTSSFHTLPSPVWPAILAEALWSLVLPLGLTIPATYYLLRVGAQQPANKSKWWVVSTLVFALCILLIVLLYSLIYSLPGKGM